MTQPIINPAEPQKVPAFAVQFHGEAERIPFARLALLFVGTQWTWSLNNRCKHLTIFMDTRDSGDGEGARMCRVYDRNEVGLTAAELSHQLELPKRAGEDDWHHRDISVEEMRAGMELSARVIEAGDKERRELLGKLAAAESTLHGIRLALDEAAIPDRDTVCEWSQAKRVEYLIQNATAYGRSARGSADKVLELRNDLDEAKRNYDGACKTIAAMHAAAMGEVCGPVRGVVEDVADLRRRCTVEKERGDELLAEGKGLEVLVGKLRAALEVVASYDKDSKHGEGICPHGCDCPNIAREALSLVPAECGKELAEAKRFADLWEKSATDFAKSAEYYQGLIDRIAKIFGPLAYVADDGSVQDSVLRAKIPELCEGLAAAAQQNRERVVKHLDLMTSELKALRDLVVGAKMLTAEQVVRLRDLVGRAKKHRAENRLNAGMMVCEDLVDAVGEVVEGGA